MSKQKDERKQLESIREERDRLADAVWVRRSAFLTAQHKVEGSRTVEGIGNLTDQHIERLEHKQREALRGKVVNERIVVPVCQVVAVALMNINSRVTA